MSIYHIEEISSNYKSQKKLFFLSFFISFFMSYFFLRFYFISFFRFFYSFLFPFYFFLFFFLFFFFFIAYFVMILSENGAQHFRWITLLIHKQSSSFFLLVSVFCKWLREGINNNESL